MKKILIVILVLSSMFVIYSQEAITIEDVNTIFQIQDDANRLASFDNWAKGLGLKRVNTENISQWVVDVKSDPMDDSKKIYFTLDPSDGVLGYDNPSLMIRWQNGDLDCFIFWDNYLGDSNKVTLRFDSDNSYEEKWSSSTDSTATFCPYPKRFIDKLLSHETMVARITPYNEGPTTLVFDVKGLKEVSSEYPELVGKYD